jgi:hypothetical protein
MIKDWEYYKNLNLPLLATRVSRDKATRGRDEAFAEMISALVSNTAQAPHLLFTRDV